VATAPRALSALAALGDQLATVGWVTDLWVAGSLATGDYLPAVSDLDLVALVDGPVNPSRATELTTIHRSLDPGIAADLRLGCIYVDWAHVSDRKTRHPAWSHGSLVERTLSGIARAELVRHGYAVLGREPATVLPAMSADDVRAAARDEVTGYWAWAARRPTMWLDPAIADLGLTSMARGRHAMRTGDLLSKTHAVETAGAPPWLIDQLRARRRGDEVTSPRMRTAVIAWRDARRTVADAQSGRALTNGSV
jgi:hypothetical protein